MTVEQIKKHIESYLRFWGLELSDSQMSELVTYLKPFSEDKDEFEQEMICEIRSMTD